MDALTKDLVKIISQTQGIYDSAYIHYLIETKRLLKETMVAPNEIESLLDYLLTFCDDDRFVCLYKKVCKRLYSCDRQAAIDYINLYRKLYWEEAFSE